MDKVAEKRPAVEQEGLLDNVKAILVELEGTTTPISFYKEKLFGYIKEHAEEYLTANYAEKPVQDLIDGLRKQATADVDAKVEGAIAIPGDGAKESEVVKATVGSINWQLSTGHCNDAVKKMAVAVWRDGYKKKAIVGELFDDVVPALKRLAEQGTTRVYVFSTRCSDSQRLLFGYSKDGDLSEMIAGFFESSVTGPKTEKDSYVKIAKEMELAPGDVLYLSHLATEVTAAHAAGMKTCLVVRPDNPPPSAHDLESSASIASFAELFGDTDVDVPHKKACRDHASPTKKPSHEHGHHAHGGHEHGHHAHGGHGHGHCDAAKEAK